MEVKMFKGVTDTDNNLLAVEGDKVRIVTTTGIVLEGVISLIADNRIYIGENYEYFVSFYSIERIEKEVM